MLFTMYVKKDEHVNLEHNQTKMNADSTASTRIMITNTDYIETLIITCSTQALNESLCKSSISIKNIGSVMPSFLFFLLFSFRKVLSVFSNLNLVVFPFNGLRCM